MCIYIYIYVSHIHPVMKTNKYTYICIDLLMLFRHLPKIFRISTPVLRWLSSIIFLMTYGCAGAYAIYMLSSVSYEYIYIYNEYIYIYIYQCCHARLDATIWKASLRTALPNTCVDKKTMLFFKDRNRRVYYMYICIYMCIQQKTQNKTRF